MNIHLFIEIVMKGIPMYTYYSQWVSEWVGGLISFRLTGGIWTQLCVGVVFSESCDRCWENILQEGRGEARLTWDSFNKEISALLSASLFPNQFLVWIKETVCFVFLVDMSPLMYHKNVYGNDVIPLLETTVAMMECSLRLASHGDWKQDDFLSNWYK